MQQGWWAGVDIGGTKTAVVLSCAPPEIVCRQEFATEPELGPEPAIHRIIAALKEILAAQGTAADSLNGIGISCGGPLDRRLGMVMAPPNLSTWIDVPIVEILRREFNCPVRLENDANAGAIAEHRFGAGRGFHNVVFLTLGTGLGSGILIDDRLYHGASDMAGEIGHVRLTRSGPIGYYRVGSAEGWASGAGIAQIAHSALDKARRAGKHTRLFEVAQERAVTARDVGLAAQAGDAVALRIIRTSGRKLGLALAILVDILNPECIVIGGLGVRLGDMFLGPAREVLASEALQPAVEACRVVPAVLGESIGDVAALCVAMDGAEHRTPA